MGCFKGENRSSWVSPECYETSEYDPGHTHQSSKNLPILGGSIAHVGEQPHLSWSTPHVEWLPYPVFLGHNFISNGSYPISTVETPKILWSTPKISCMYNQIIFSNLTWQPGKNPTLRVVFSPWVALPWQNRSRALRFVRLLQHLSGQVGIQRRQRHGRILKDLEGNRHGGYPKMVDL